MSAWGVSLGLGVYSQGGPWVNSAITKVSHEIQEKKGHGSHEILSNAIEWYSHLSPGFSVEVCL